MTDLNRELQELVDKACSHPPGNAVRQKSLTEIIRRIQPQLWRDNTPSYQDALQQTWLYFCRNICEATTGERYNPDRASLITWLNYYLKRRLQDIQIDKDRDRSKFGSSSYQGANGETIDVIEQQPAPPDTPPILEDVKNWVEADADGTLRGTHIKGKPHINCQLLILQRLPPETPWKQLSADLGVGISTLSGFYERKCLPKLRNFARLGGYV
jgi:hypothetical protein